MCGAFLPRNASRPQDQHQRAIRGHLESLSIRATTGGGMLIDSVRNFIMVPLRVLAVLGVAALCLTGALASLVMLAFAISICLRYTT